MKAIVLGATGFVGRHVVRALLARGHSVVAVGRDFKNFDDVGVECISLDLYAKKELTPRAVFGHADVVIDLVWPGLPNYKDLFHVEENFPNSYRMLRSFITDGYDRIVVAGTCLEYGMRSGPVEPSMDAKPVVAYAVAKDLLRRSLEVLAQKYSANLSWCRLFYLFGEGQHQQSLIPQLKQAIAVGDGEFDMSGGEQLRDFVHVTDAAEALTRISEFEETSGVFNICSGQPVSVRRFVERIIAGMNAEIRLNLGHYPYPDYEPMAFWGVCSSASVRTGDIS